MKNSTSSKENKKQRIIDEINITNGNLSTEQLVDRFNKAVQIEPAFSDKAFEYFLFEIGISSSKEVKPCRP